MKGGDMKGIYDDRRQYRLICCFCLVAKLCLTLCNLMVCSPPGSSIHGLLQARILEWVAISFSGVFPTQGLNPRLLICIAGRFFTTEPPGKYSSESFLSAYSVAKGYARYINYLFLLSVLCYSNLREKNAEDIEVM